jgi:hypothetical protein
MDLVLPLIALTNLDGGLRSVVSRGVIKAMKVCPLYAASNLDFLNSNCPHGRSAEPSE